MNANNLLSRLLFLKLLLLTATGWASPNHTVTGAFGDARYGDLLLTTRGVGINLDVSGAKTILLNGQPASLEDLPRGKPALAVCSNKTGRVVRLEVIDPQAERPAASRDLYAIYAGHAYGEQAPSRPFALGEWVEVELRAPGGGEASFDIAGFAQNIPVREVSPGVYRGRWRVPKGADSYQTFVLGHFRRGEWEAPLRVGPALQLAPTPPTIEAAGPRSTSELPVVFARFASAGSLVEKIQLVIDGRDYTSRAQRTATAVMVEIPELEPGTHRAKLWLRDKAGNRRLREWTFEVH